MQNNYKKLKFKSIAGNSYIYDDLDGTVIPESYINYKKRPIHQFNNADEGPFFKAILNDKEIIKNFLFYQGYTQLQLVVTEQCNLRCKYCCYSGQYPNNRTHGSDCMEWGIAEKAINTFVRGLLAVKAQRPGLRPAISFYGGEPLLNFGLIRDSVALIKKLYQGNIVFNLTTNGTLLKPEMLTFFYENDFALTFSLNGYPEEHDRLRIFPNGTGSFDLAWHNLQAVRHKNPLYFNQNCSLSVVFDYGTDLNRLSSFLENRRAVLPGHFELNSVVGEFTQYYSRYSDKDRLRFNESLDHFQRLYINTLLKGEKPSQFLQILCGRVLEHIMLRLQNTSNVSPVLPFTSTCFPGMKMAAYPDGSFHCCERINSHFPIGDVNSGIDYDLILNLINKYRSQIYPECYQCPITRLCRFCFATLAGDEIFQRDPSDRCKIEIETIRDELATLWSLFEKGVSEAAFVHTHKIDNNE
jgi:uncharacterized protein